MYKIESVSTDAKATIVRYGVEMLVFPGLSVTSDEIKDMKVTQGSVEYSVYEKELVTVKAEPVAPVVPVIPKAVSVTPVAPVVKK